MRESKNLLYKSLHLVLDVLAAGGLRVAHEPGAAHSRLAILALRVQFIETKISIRRYNTPAKITSITSASENVISSDIRVQENS